MTVQRTPVPKEPPKWPNYVMLSVLVIFAGCCGVYRWFIYDIEDRPPELTAEYESSEAILAAEELAGELLTDLPVDEDGLSAFDSRTWKTSTCRSGWNDHLSWDGFVSVSVKYDFDIHEDDLSERIEYARLIAEALGDLGLDPTLEEDDDGEVGVSAERDDGLSIGYNSTWGLSIGTACVVQDDEPVYTSPHVRISPGSDHQHLERWPEPD